MTQKLHCLHIAAALAVGLTAQPVLAQTPPVEHNTSVGQEDTPMIKLDDSNYSGQGFFDKPAAKKTLPPARNNPTPDIQEKVLKKPASAENAPSVIVAPVPSSSWSAPSKTLAREPTLPLNIVGSKDARENTKGGLTPPLAKKERSPAATRATPGLLQASAPETPVQPRKKPPSANKPLPKKSAPPTVPVQGPGPTAIPIVVKTMPAEFAAPGAWPRVASTPGPVMENVPVTTASMAQLPSAPGGATLGAPSTTAPSVRLEKPLAPRSGTTLRSRSSPSRDAGAAQNGAALDRDASSPAAASPEKGDFIAFMPGSSHISEETVESLRTMVGLFEHHGIRKIVLTGTCLSMEDGKPLPTLSLAQQRAVNLQAAFVRAGFKGAVVLDEPRRAAAGTTPRVGLVAWR